jgi:Beta-lactamase
MAGHRGRAAFRAVTSRLRCHAVPEFAEGDAVVEGRAVDHLAAAEGQEWVSLRPAQPGSVTSLYTPVVAGISVAFTSPAGISAEASGAASPDGTPLTPDSMFQAGSVSKAVTAFAAHRLAAEGRLDLDADVNEILTSWQLPQVREWRPGVTVRDLLAHMAGVSGSWGEGTARGEPVPGLLEILAGTAVAPPVALEALPGLTWAYSGSGYLIAACASPSTAATSTPGALRRRNRRPSPPPCAPPRGPRRAGPRQGPGRRTSRRAGCRPVGRRPASSTPGPAARRSSPGHPNR